MGMAQSKNSCKTAAVVGLLSRGRESKPNVQTPPVGLGGAGEPRTALADRQDEGRLNELAQCIRERDREDQQLANVMLAHAVEKGRWLTEAKAMVPYGEWGNWLKEKVDYSQSKAQGLMKLYQKFGSEQESLFGPPKSQALGNLSVTKALMLIDIPDEELGEVMEEHDLESMTTREVAALKKELADAKVQAKQAQAEQAAAEQAREKISQEMDLANGRIAGLNDLVERYSAEARERQEELARITAEAGERQEEIARITAELKELKERPVEVAVEADPAAIEAARKEAEAAMRDKLDKAKANQKKAQADLAEVSSALERARLERERVEAELRKQLAQAEKRAALASSEDFVLFKTILERLQEDGNRLCGLILKERNKDQERAERFSNAFFACLDKMRKEAQG